MFLGSVWDLFVMVWERFWDRLGIVLARSCIVLGWFWGRFGMALGWLLGRFWHGLDSEVLVLIGFGCVCLKGRGLLPMPIQ